MIRERVRDEAVAAAKASSHEAVELRHLLVALVKILGSEVPRGVSLDRAQALLSPAGSAWRSPRVEDEAESKLANLDSLQAAITLCSQLATDLLGVHPEPAAHLAVASESEVTARRQAEADREEPTASPEALLAELDDLVGLEPVKASVRRLVAVQRFNAERLAAGLPQVNASNHVVFTGDPGTGKTTVARIIARLYGAIGVVSKGHLVEASRADLVAGYVGQTALKVQYVVDKAVGGVLFIDEAYSLASNESADFGGDAIATLVKLMEDHRGDLAVIVAGYRNEMQLFINSNPGLRSRFTHYIDFPDYQAEELVRIFSSIASQAHVRLVEGVEDRLLTTFREAAEIGNFGNARFARSVFEQAYAHMATRALEDGKVEVHEMHEMTVEDLPFTGRPLTEDDRRIGFRVR